MPSPSAADPSRITKVAEGPGSVWIWVHAGPGVPDRQIEMPWSYRPRLRAAPPAARRAWEVTADGRCLLWPALDESVSLEGLLRDVHRDGDPEWPRDVTAQGVVDR